MDASQPLSLLPRDLAGTIASATEITHIIDSLSCRLVTLKGHQNTFSSIARLPVEVLSAVFDQAVLIAHNMIHQNQNNLLKLTVMSFSQVCHR